VSARSYLGGKVVVHDGDCLDVLRGMESCSVDSVKARGKTGHAGPLFAAPEAAE
jgi:hypothetical protein